MEGMIPNCLFCVEKLERSPFQIRDDGTLTRPPVGEIPLVFSNVGQDSAVHDHLKTFFVLKYILKIENEVLAEFLGINEGASRPENWVNVCEECGKLVKKFYEDLQHSRTLDRRLVKTEEVLREKIVRSMGTEGGGDHIWQRIRSEAMKVYKNDNQEDEEDQRQNEDNPPNFDEESSQVDETEADDAVPSPCPSFVPDSPSKPFEFWDSEEEDLHEQIKAYEKVLTKVGGEEKIGEDARQPIFIDLVSDDEEDGAGHENPKQPPPSLTQANLAVASASPSPHLPSESREIGTAPFRNLPMPLNSINNELLVKPESVENLRNELEIEVDDNHDDSDSSATLSAPNTPMCLSSDDEEDFQVGIRAVEGKRKQIFIRNPETTTLPKKLKVHPATRCPKPNCGRFVLRDSLEEHHRSHLLLDAKRSHLLLVSKQIPSIIKTLSIQKPGYKIFQGVGKKMDYKCSLCPASFAYLTAIKKHCQLHVPGSEVKICEENECGWYVAPHQMIRHRSSKHPHLKYTCETCNAIYTSYDGILNHQKLHQTGKGLTCKECGWLVTNLNYHNTKWHPNSASQVQLPLPTPPKHKRKLPIPPRTREHKMRNVDNSNPLYISFSLDGMKLYKCRQCGRRMRSLPLLKSHLKVHDDPAACGPAVSGLRRSVRIMKTNN